MKANTVKTFTLITAPASNVDKAFADLEKRIKTTLLSLGECEVLGISHSITIGNPSWFTATALITYAE